MVLTDPVLRTAPGISIGCPAGSSTGCVRGSSSSQAGVHVRSNAETHASEVLAAPGHTWVEKWSTPPHGWLKLNVDGAFQAQVGNGGIVMVLRDSSGCIIFTSCVVIYSHVIMPSLSNLKHVERGFRLLWSGVRFRLSLRRTVLKLL